MHAVLLNYRTVQLVAPYLLASARKMVKGAATSTEYRVVQGSPYLGLIVMSLHVGVDAQYTSVWGCFSASTGPRIPVITRTGKEATIFETICFFSGGLGLHSRNLSTSRLLQFVPVGLRRSCEIACFAPFGYLARIIRSKVVD